MMVFLCTVDGGPASANQDSLLSGSIGCSCKHAQHKSCVMIFPGLVAFKLLCVSQCSLDIRCQFC